MQSEAASLPACELELAVHAAHVLVELLEALLHKQLGQEQVFYAQLPKQPLLLQLGAGGEEPLELVEQLGGVAAVCRSVEEAEQALAMRNHTQSCR